MTNRPLDAYSEVVDAKQRWTVEWYTWLQKVAGDLDSLLLPATTVAALPTPSVALKGTRRFVNNATQTFTSANFGAIVTGGGSNNVPVVCDGTNWKIG
jgi:hypothetical protein